MPLHACSCAHAPVRMPLCPCPCAHAPVPMCPCLPCSITALCQPGLTTPSSVSGLSWTLASSFQSMRWRLSTIGAVAWMVPCRCQAGPETRRVWHQQPWWQSWHHLRQWLQVPSNSRVASLVGCCQSRPRCAVDCVWPSSWKPPPLCFSSPPFSQSLFSLSHGRGLGVPEANGSRRGRPPTPCATVGPVYKRSQVPGVGWLWGPGGAGGCSCGLDCAPRDPWGCHRNHACFVSKRHWRWGSG
jgi:hypothetical protein